MIDALRAIPDGIRKGAYVVYALAGLTLGSVAAYAGATDNAVPEWTVGGLAVLAYLGVPIGAVAATNVARPD